jgi:hypothetical protein
MRNRNKHCQQQVPQIAVLNFLFFVSRKPKALLFSTAVLSIGLAGTELRTLVVLLVMHVYMAFGAHLDV